jgi:hypothetical protein
MAQWSSSRYAPYKETAALASGQMFNPRVQQCSLCSTCLAVCCFVQVVFSYNPSPRVQPVLRGLSFLAPGGRSLAVVGSTGSGKSTLLRCAGCAVCVPAFRHTAQYVYSWPGPVHPASGLTAWHTKAGDKTQLCQNQDASLWPLYCLAATNNQHA